MSRKTGIFQHHRTVRAAQARALAARHELAEPVDALLARGERYPLTTLGLAAGVGVALGSLDVHPLKVPGLGALLNGTASSLLQQGVQMVVEFVQDQMSDDEA